MLGTVIVPVNLISASNVRIMDLRVGDRVEGDGVGNITKVWRGGIPKFPTANIPIGFVKWSGFIKPDSVVEPPPTDETPPIPDEENPNPLPVDVLNVDLTFVGVVIGPSPRLNGVKYKVDDSQS